MAGRSTRLAGPTFSLSSLHDSQRAITSTHFLLPRLESLLARENDGAFYPLSDPAAIPGPVLIPPVDSAKSKKKKIYYRSALQQRTLFAPLYPAYLEIWIPESRETGVRVNQIPG